MAETPEQRVAELDRRISVLNNRKQLFLNRAQTQRRKDRTRRAIVLGELINARAEVDPAVRKLLEDVVRKGVEERQQYLFPTIWPKSVRPSGRKKEGEGSDAADPSVQ